MRSGGGFGVVILVGLLVCKIGRSGLVMGDLGSVSASGLWPVGNRA